MALESIVGIVIDPTQYVVIDVNTLIPYIESILISFFARKHALQCFDHRLTDLNDLGVVLSKNIDLFLIKQNSDFIGVLDVPFHVFFSGLEEGGIEGRWEEKSIEDELFDEFEGVSWGVFGQKGGVEVFEEVVEPGIVVD